MNRVVALIELAGLYEKMDNMNEAKECYEDCIEIQKTSMPNARSAVAKTMFKFGILMVKMDEEDKALSLLQQALKIQKKASGSHDHLPTLLKIGEIYMQKCLYKEALETLLKTVSKWPEHRVEEAADCNRNIGVIYIALEDFENALPYLRDAVDLYEKNDIEDDRRSSSLHLYGKCLCMTSEFTIAREKIIEGKYSYSQTAVFLIIQFIYQSLFKCSPSNEEGGTRHRFYRICSIIDVLGRN